MARILSIFECGTLCRKLRQERGWSLADLAMALSEWRWKTEPDAKPVGRTSIFEAELGRNRTMQRIILIFFHYDVEDVRRVEQRLIRNVVPYARTR